MMTSDIREDVRKKYAQAITNKLNCCGNEASDNPVTGNLYEKNKSEGLPDCTQAEQEELGGALISAFIRAKKPKESLTEGQDYRIRNAQEEDLLLIHQLLTDNGLTTEGVKEHLHDFLVADDQGIIGVIGLEFSDTAVMLRSLAVDKKIRKRGIASALVDHALNIGRAKGSVSAYLLTTTADQFAARWGFNNIERSEIPEILLQSSALNHFCPDSSICMKLSF